jgi:HlyD family secretion protein
MKRRRRTIWLVVLVLVLVAAGGGAYYYWRLRPGETQPRVSTSVNTTHAFRGDLVISATGVGAIIPASEVTLGFPSSGTLVELNVQVGDTVKAGDVLARIDDLEARKSVSSAEAQVLSAETALATARQNYADLTAEVDEAELLQAQAAVLLCEETLADLRTGAGEAEVASARAALLTAEESYNRLVNGPDESELKQQELQLAQAKNSLWATQLSRDAKGTEEGKSSGSYDQAQVSVLNSEISVQLAEMALAELKAAPSEAELQAAMAEVAASRKALADLTAGASDAEISQAEAELAAAQEALEELTAGPSEDDIAAAEREVRQAELSLTDAELNLESAQASLEKTTLVAPCDGTITAVTAAVGDSVGSGLITLAAAGQPRLEVYLDETDMDQVAVGYEVEIVLEAKPDLTFLGTVVRVDPSLVTTNGMSAVSALVELSPDSFAKPQNLLLGMSATADVIGGRAEGAVLVPVEALREIDEDEYGVFVMQDGELRFRSVTVGLMDLTYAEVVSGLQVGETVSTGMVETL